MTLKARILLFTLAGLIGVLIGYSLMIYVFFVKTTTDAELQLMWNRAQTVLRKPEVRQSSQWDDAALLQEFTSGRTMLRIIDPEGRVRSEAGVVPELSAVPPEYYTAYHTRMINRGGMRIISIQIPIRTIPGNRQIGVLELSKLLYLTRGYLRIILLTLASGVAVGSLFAVLIAVTYSRWIYKPVAELAGTMERIETSGTFARISGRLLEGKDEFARLGATFNRMMERLEDHFNRQRQFVQDASHELRTPLTVIQSYSAMLRRWGGGDPALREEAVTAIEQESARLKELVDSLLRTADKGGNLQGAGRRPFDLLELAKRTSRELSRSFRRRIRVEQDREPGVFRIDGQPERLKQLLIILLDNALKYSSKPIVVRLESGKDRILLQVIDEGIGIAKEHIRHLFDRFYRADSARTRKTGGSGLGLSIAREIVTEHGGSVKISSKPGKGTTVSVYLPASHRPDSEEEPPDGLPVPPA